MFEIEPSQLDVFEIDMFQLDPFTNRSFGMSDSIKKRKPVISLKLYGKTCNTIKVILANLSCGSAIGKLVIQ